MGSRSPSGRQEGIRAALVEHAAELERRFGKDGAGPPRAFFSPGRVNLMGAHLDYNGGSVMPLAIDRGTFLAIRARDDRTVRLVSTAEEASCELSLDDLPAERRDAWYDYPLGVIVRLSERAPDAPGFDLLFGGDLAIGAGLSSSASICVGTAWALDRLWRLGLATVELVDAALWAEREFVGVRCGIMDPYAVGYARPGHILHLDCRDRSTTHLPFDPDAVCIAVVDSGVRRELAHVAFNERVDECRACFEALRRFAPRAGCLSEIPLAVLDRDDLDLEPTLGRRARHVLSEVRRTEVAREALLRGDLRAFGRAMLEAHLSLREHYEVSVPELDCIVAAAARWDGVWGARLTGAGFGGCVVALLAPSAREGFAEHLTGIFRGRFGRDPGPIEFFRGDGGPREIQL